MKKLLAAIILVGGMFSASLASGTEATGTRNLTTAAAQAERIAEISARVNEIKEIDRNSVSNAEWKEIKKELKKYKKELKEIKAKEPYIYISLTVLLLVIILIILIA